MQTLNRSAYQFDLVENVDELKQLYGIDESAYDDSSISFEAFFRWWNAYDLGLKVVKVESGIVAALGLWGMSEESTRLFLSGRLREDELTPLETQSVAIRPTQYWYCSGLVSLQKKTLDSPLRLILRGGIAAWVSTCHVRYPAQIYALGYSEDGIEMLTRFKFEAIRSADEMPDGCPLYWRSVNSKNEAIALFGGKK